MLNEDAVAMLELLQSVHSRPDRVMYELRRLEWSYDDIHTVYPDVPVKLIKDWVHRVRGRLEENVDAEYAKGVADGLWTWNPNEPDPQHDGKDSLL